jgi:ribonuclease HI
MANLSYAYLKLKIPGPAGIITVEAKAQRALDCEQASTELATVTVTAAELKELCLNPQPLLADPAMPSTSGTFMAAEDAKAVRINKEDLTKTV